MNDTHNNVKEYTALQRNLTFTPRVLDTTTYADSSEMTYCRLGSLQAITCRTTSGTRWEVETGYDLENTWLYILSEAAQREEL